MSFTLLVGAVLGSAALIAIGRASAQKVLVAAKTRSRRNARR